MAAGLELRAVTRAACARPSQVDSAPLPLAEGIPPLDLARGGRRR